MKVGSAPLQNNVHHCIIYRKRRVQFWQLSFRMLQMSLHTMKWKAKLIRPSTRHCREALEHLTPLVWHNDIWHRRVALHLCVLGMSLKKKALLRKTFASIRHQECPLVDTDTVYQVMKSTSMVSLGFACFTPPPL